MKLSDEALNEVRNRMNNPDLGDPERVLFAVTLWLHEEFNGFDLEATLLPDLPALAELLDWSLERVEKAYELAVELELAPYF